MAKQGWTAMKRLGAALAVASLLVPAIAIAKPDKRPPAVKVKLDRVGGFTPANTDPKLAAALASRGIKTSDFKFTPAAPKNRPSQVRVAIRARADTPAPDATPALGALTQSSYNLGVSVGWRRFAVTGDVARSESDAPTLGSRERAIVGVNYSISNRLTGRVAASAERADRSRAPALGSEQAYSLDVGGAYKLSRNVSVTGGVRYRIQDDRDAALSDDRQDSQAVYVGTAFKF